MDSLSQIALGAAVSVAVFRRKQPLWRSALLGAVVGTLPDLDVFLAYDDPISDMTYHRTETHSLFYLTMVAPLLAWLYQRLSQTPNIFKTAWLAIWLVLVTHPLLDTLTIYGTQLALPFSDHPFGTGSVFVIDLLYTLPLLIGTGLVLAGRSLRWNSFGLLLSTSYLAFGLWAQQQVTTLARQQLPTASAQQLLVTATPFNTVLWRILVIEPEQYWEGYYSLLDASPKINWQVYPRGGTLLDQWQSQPQVARLTWFSHGFVSLKPHDEHHLVLADLRMGMEPAYSFSFLLPLPKTQSDAKLETRNASAIASTAPSSAMTVGNPATVQAHQIVQQEMPRDTRALSWLYQRLLARTELSLVEFLAKADAAADARSIDTSSGDTSSSDTRSGNSSSANVPHAVEKPSPAKN